MRKPAKLVMVTSKILQNVSFLKKLALKGTVTQPSRGGGVKILDFWILANSEGKHLEIWEKPENSG